MKTKLFTLLFFVFFFTAIAQVPSYVPTNGLIAHYPFNGNANDESGNAHNGTVINGAFLTTDRFGNLNNAYSFDGINDYIIANIGSLQAISVSVWINSSEPIQWYPIVAMYAQYIDFLRMSGNNPIYISNGIVGNINSEYLPATPNYIGTNFNLSFDSWHHIVVVFDNSVGKYELYVDNILVGSSVTTGPIAPTSSTILFGNSVDGINADGGAGFKGSIDDVDIWDRALTPQEISGLYNTCTPPPAPVASTNQTFCVSPAPTVASLSATGTGIQWYGAETGGNLLANTATLTDGQTVYASQTENSCESTTRTAVTVSLNDPQITASATTVCAGTAVNLSASTTAAGVTANCTLPANLQNGLVGYWPFCGNANDASGNGNNGTVNGATLTSDRFGNSANSYQFTANTDMVGIPNTTINPQDFTLSAWCKLNDPFVYTTFSILEVANLDYTTVGGFGLHMTQNDPIFGTGNYKVYSFAGNFETVESNILNYNFVSNWNHYLVTKQNGIISLYINNQLITSNTVLGITDFANAYLQIGSRQQINDNPLSSRTIDDVIIWNHALSTSEISQLYNLGQTTYLWSTGETTATISPSPTATSTYWCDVTVNGVTCRKEVTITVNSTTTAPEAAATQTFCVSPLPTVTSLSATGTGIQWYDAATGGNLLASTTVLTDGQTVYASQTENSCESTTRTAVTVSLNDPQITASATTVCAGSMVNLSISTTNEIPQEISNFSGPYFFNNHTYFKSLNSTIWLNAIQTCNSLNGYLAIPNSFEECEFLASIFNNSTTIHIGITDLQNEGVWLDVLGNPLIYTNWAPSEPNNEQNEDFGQMYSNNFWNDQQGGNFDVWPYILEFNSQTTYLWSTGETTASINPSPTATTTYWCDVTVNGATCRKEVTITVNSTTPAPVASANQTFCVSPAPTVASLSANGTAILWYDTTTGGNLLTSTTTLTDGQTVYASQTENSCESTTRTAVTVSLNDPQITASATTVCAGTAVNLSASTTAAGVTANCNLPTNLQNGLVGYWPFCGNANDASGNGNNGTVNGATLTTDRFGNADSAYSFDGVSSFIQCNSVNLNSTFTTEFWYKNANDIQTNATSGHPPIGAELLGQGTQHQPYVSYSDFAYGISNYGNSTNHFALEYSGPVHPQNTDLISNNLGTFNQWNQVVVVRNGTSCDYYLNGSLQNSYTLNNNLLNTGAPLSIGARLIYNSFQGGNQSSNYYKGEIDNISLWNRNLSVSEIAQLYNAGQTTYLWSTGETTASINPSPTATTTYWCDVTVNGATCRKEVTITVNSTTTAPVASANQTFCVSPAPTVASLSATGTDIQWYDAATGGNLMASTATLTDGQTVYASQSENSCESTTRTAVTVSFNDPQIAASATTVCAGTAVNLSASTNAAVAGTGNTLPSNLQNGLVGYWPFNGNVNDESGNGNNGSVLPGATLTSDRNGISNSSYLFDGLDGTNKGITMPFIAPPLSDFSLSMWFQVLDTVKTGQNMSQTIFSTSTNGAIGASFNHPYAPGNMMSCVMNLCYPNNPNSWSLENINNWHQLTVSKNGTFYEYYIDGTLRKTLTWNETLFNINLLNIGAISWSSGEVFAGKIDDVYAWNKSLSASEVQQVFNQGQTTYLWSTGETTATINPTPTATTTYWCDVTVNGATCRKEVTITVNSSTPEPVAAATQTFCGSPAPTVASLSATGTGIQWYDAATGGNLLSSTATLTDGQTVYASQTENSCESTTRTAVTVSVNDPQITASATIICSGTSVNLSVGSTNSSLTQFQNAHPELTLFHTIGDHGYFYKNQFETWQQSKAFGDQIGISLYVINDAVEELSVYNSLPNIGTDGIQYWIGLYQDLTSPNYSEPSGGWKWVDNSPLIYTNWYTSEPSNGQNGESFGQFDWDIIGIKWNDAGNITNNNGCACDFAYPIYEFHNQANYLWSTGETTATINPSPTATTTYWCDVTVNGATCRKEVTITVNSTTPAPVASANQTFCVSPVPTVASLSATGTSIQWYDAATGGNLLANTTTLSDGQTLYASQTENSCESTTRTAVTVSVNDPQITASATTVCAGAPVNLSVTGVNYNSGAIGNTQNPNPWPFPSAFDAGIISLGQFGTPSVFSTSFWINPESTQNGISIILDCSHGGSSNWVLQSFGDNNYTWGSLTVSLTPNVWQHVLLTYNNGVKKCYINGQLNSTVNQSISYSGVPNLNLGNWPEGGRRFNGKIDELYVTFNELETTNFTPQQNISTVLPNSMGLWHFDEGTGTASTNSINSNNLNIGSWYWTSRGQFSSSYLWSTGETTASINPSPTATTTYWCDVTVNGATCRKEVTITVNSTTPAPVASANQTFCISPAPTVASLSATGTSIQWYDAATGGNLLASTTALTDGQTVYASQTENSCESTTRTAVTVSVNDPQITASATTVCAGTAVNLSASTTAAGVTANCTLPANLQNGLVGYWPFCGNANDASGNGNNGTVNGATLTTDRFGNTNSAYSFDGVSNFIQVQTPSFSSAITISLWTFDLGGYPNSYSINPRYVSSEFCNGSFALVNNVNNQPNGIFFTKNRGDSSADIFSNVLPTYQTNQHLVFTFDGTVGKFYVNGNLLSTVNNPGNISQISTLLFGKSGCPFGQMVDAFKGNLDDISIFNRSLSETEIAQLYNPGVTYLWSTGETTASINPSPTVTTTYWCDVTVNGTTCRKEVTINVNSSTPAPVASANQTFCVSPAPTIASLSATGTSIQWYDAATGGNLLASTATLTDGQTVYASQTENSCESTTRTAVTLSFNDPQITASATTVCAGTAVNLSASTTAAGITADCTLPTNLQNGLVGYWPFCGNANDVSGNGNNGLLQTGNNGSTNYVTDRLGNVNSAIEFTSNPTWNSLGSYIEIPNSQNLLVNSDFTITYSIKVSGQNQVGEIINKGRDNIQNLFISRVANGILQNAITGVGGFNISNFPIGSWQTVSITYSNSVLSYYLNGIFQQSTFASPIQSTASKYYFGAMVSGGSNGSYYPFQGVMDDISFHNRALNQSEIAQLYSSAPTYLWSTGETTASINPSPTATTTYWCDVTVNGATCRKEVSITVNPQETPLFTQVAPICAGGTLAALPTTSTNGITGTWSPALDNAATTLYTFTPTAGLCATTATMTITVNPNIVPTFTQVAPICAGETLAALPTTSTNGITGAWSPTLNNASTTLYTFTPTAGLCATTATMNITVNPNIVPTFTQVIPICAGETLTDLPTISDNDISGTWSPALNNTATTQYTFTPTAGLCATTATMTIEVNPNILPIFTQVAPICAGGTLAALPTTSSNGISGTWSPAVNNAVTTLYTFTPTTGLCATTATMNITVNPNIVPTFTQVIPICAGETLTDLPTISDNDISGTWSPAVNNAVTTLYTFTPTVGLCAATATMTITVNTNIAPTFTQVAPICAGETLAALPTTSTNGITGAWSPTLNNASTTLYTFTPTAGLCATTATMTITVNPNIVPTFTQVTPICAGETLTDLPTISDNGISGTWSPALNNTATTQYTFTPTAGLCATTATMTITVNPNILPIFTQVTPICAGTTLTDLPTISDNDISGTWSPALNNTATTQYTFTPTAGLCATTAIMTIEVNPNILPIFTQVAPICAGTTLTDLPTTSDNGITGTWSPALNNTATSQYTFTPTAGLCATTATMTIEVNPNIVPTFTQVAPICAGATLAALPTTSNNGITGTWSPALNNAATTLYTFTPTAGLCATTATMTITVNPNIVPTFTQVAPICAGATLATLPTKSNNGITGTWSPALNNAATTLYTFTPTAGLCATTATMTITVNPNIVPTFTQVAPICAGGTLASLPTTSNNGITGTWSPALDNLTTTTYLFAPNAGQCATTASLTISVRNIPQAPTGDDNQVFCASSIPTVGSIVLNVPNIRWYISSTETVPVPLNTNLVNGAVYYAVQFDAVTGCESNTRFMVTVTLIDEELNVGIPDQTFCNSEIFTIADIKTNGTSIYWYANPVGGDQLPLNTLLYDGDVIYATNYSSVSGCESSDRQRIVINFVPCEIEINNLITLDGNDLNDNLNIINIENFENNNIEIFNRYGQLVWSTDRYNNTNNAFKGRANVSGVFRVDENLPTGVYFYILRYKKLYQNDYKEIKGYLYISNNQ